MTKPKTDPLTAAVTVIQGPVLFLKPAKDRRVRKPSGELLDDAGENVAVEADWPFWLRRLADEDVTAAEPIFAGDDE